MKKHSRDITIILITVILNTLGIFYIGKYVNRAVPQLKVGDCVQKEEAKGINKIVGIDLNTGKYKLQLLMHGNVFIDFTFGFIDNPNYKKVSCPK